MSNKPPEEKKRKGPWTAENSPVVKWRNSLTPEQREAHYKRLAQAGTAKRMEKVALLEEAKRKSYDLLPELIAQQYLLADKDDYKPTNEMLGQIRDLMNKGLSVEKMRQGAFRALSDKSWQKLTKFLFKDHVSQSEDLGLELLNKKHAAIETLKKRVRMIRKEIKQYKKTTDKVTGKSLFVPPALLKVLGETEDKLMSLEFETANTLHNIGAVGEKAKAASITIITNTPRPRSEEAIDITPKTESLAELVKANG